ncbi:MAG: pilus assembly protein [Deltaproteobacteria bacterium]|nr:MAG: pilus assembly protein [Deltaproteobacteria bacterium]
MRRTCKRIRQGERGLAALEFALTFPLFIAVLGFGLSLGTYLWAQQQMLSVATTAARYCAFNLPEVNNTSAMSSCATSQVATLVGMSPIVGCNSTPSVSVDFPSANSPTVTNMGLLRVTLSCQNTWYAMMDALGTNLHGDKTLTVVGTMPFITL